MGKFRPAPLFVSAFWVLVVGLALVVFMAVMGHIGADWLPTPD